MYMLHDARRHWLGRLIFAGLKYVMLGQLGLFTL